jgi:Flp pilus assembly pilin Flp
MRKLARFMLTGDDNGQAIVEYALMLSVAVGLVGLIAVGFRSSIIGLWKSFARDITSACPTGCPPPANVQ